MPRELQRVLKLGVVIDYYDGPLLFTAVDVIGTLFLCSILCDTEKGPQYLAVPISRTKLDSFLNGKIDLRSVYIFPEIDEFYFVNATSSPGELRAVLTERTEIPQNLFPLDGYYITEPIIYEPLATNRALLEASLDVAEAKNAPVIDTYTCSDFLKILQDVLKYAYKKALVEVPAEIRKAISGDQYFKTEVFGTAGGSFTVKLRSATVGDLQNYVELDRGIAKVMQIFDAANDRQLAISIFKENRGHFVSAFNHLLDLLIEQKCSVSLTWQPTEFGKPAHRSKITRDEANYLQSALAEQSDLSNVSIELDGIAVDALTARKVAWTLKTDDGELHSGIIDPDIDISLIGVTLGNRYRYYCREILRESAIGRRHTEMYLYRYQAL